MFVKIFGVFLILTGAIMVIKSEWFLKNFGRIDWAERKLGGTLIFYKLAGIVFIFFGMTMFFDLFGGIVYWILGPLLPK